MQNYELLECEWAKVHGLEPSSMVACSSGTAALHLAFETLSLLPGSRVIVPDFAMVACARAVAMAGLEPVFVDCDMDGNLSPSAVLRALETVGRPVAALLAVHTYGRRCRMDTLAYIAGRNGLVLIEDLAEAHSLLPHSSTDAACWSFYRNKVVRGEEGGAVHLPRGADRARSLRSMGFTNAHDFTHIPRGCNYRLANSLADRVLRSVRRMELALKARRELEAVCEAACPVDWRLDPRDVPWVYDFRVPGMQAEAQDRVVAALQRKLHIEARHAFKPLSRQREFLACWNDGGPVAARLSREVIYLPLDPDLLVPASLAFAAAVDALTE